MNGTTQQEKTTQLVSRNETTQLGSRNETTQPGSRNETTQLCTAVDRLQSPTTACNAFTAESAFSTYSRWLFSVPPCRKGTIHLQTSMFFSGIRTQSLRLRSQRR
ncbi:hypothetical protein TNCV_1417541 [Trichonephila clavipes]|nr:hypothetical protein TNCV_1417541 [Trichonephila clavipes]